MDGLIVFRISFCLSWGIFLIKLDKIIFPKNFKLFILFLFAHKGTRTPTLTLAKDFKSSVSTYSTMRALQYSFLQGSLHLVKHFPNWFTRAIVLSQIAAHVLVQSKNFLLQYIWGLSSQCATLNIIINASMVFITLYKHYYNLEFWESQEKLISLELIFFCGIL